MARFEELDSRIEQIVRTLDRLGEAKSEICENLIAGGVAAGTYPGLAELENVRVSAAKIRQELDAIKHKGKLDPQVRELDRKLEEALSRYYWLWQQCKQNMD